MTLLVDADPAATLSSMVDHSERMPLVTGLFGSVHSRGTITSQDVDPVGDIIEMIGVDAVSHPTQVIEFSWDPASEDLVDHSMGTTRRAFPGLVSIPDPAVPVRSDGTGPQPAGLSFEDLAPDPFLDGYTRGTRHGNYYRFHGRRSDA